MELIERYVNEVGRQLPRGEREDIRRELRSSLFDSLDARVEGEPGESDVVALLEELGPPEKVAASYRAPRQYLIGPELFPTFRRVVGIVMLALAGALTLALALSLSFRPPSAGAELGATLLGWLGGLWDACLAAFGIVVLIFAALQRLGLRHEESKARWDPRRLPAVPEEDLVGRGETVFGFVVSALALALLIGYRDRLGIVVNPGGELLLNRVFLDSLPWIGAALVSGMALKLVLLWRGRWQGATRAVSVALDLFGVYVAYRVAAGVVAEKAALAEALPGPLPALVVQTAWIVVAVIAFFVAVDTVKVVLRIARRSVAETSAAR